MTEKTERLNDTATVKGTMLRAHLAWAAEKLGDPASAISPHLDAPLLPLVQQPIAPTQWVPFRSLVRIDEAIAKQAGGAPEDTYLELGRYSARINLEGVYKGYVTAEPHRFFEKGSLLHDRFQNFGRSDYEKLGDRSGRTRMEDYPVFSPVFCATALGYYQEALHMMHAPGPIVVRETSCLCSGDKACVFEMSW